jgi:hypothetical protein
MFLVVFSLTSMKSVGEHDVSVRVLTGGAGEPLTAKLVDVAAPLPASLGKKQIRQNPFSCLKIIGNVTGLCKKPNWSLPGTVIVKST